jgi:hypothetical protein
VLSGDGVLLGWNDKEQMIEKVGKPVFSYAIGKYEPEIYQSKAVNDSFRDIKEMLTLASKYHFSLTFFINPFYYPKYIQNAESLFIVKKRLAALTDYYDFSGFNSVSMDPLNYYEESHYRFRVGDMIVARLFNLDSETLPNDFGVLVTRQNVERHLEKQKRELNQYLQSHHLQS